MLVADSIADQNRAPVSMRAWWRNFEYFTGDAQSIAGTGGSRPGNLASHADKTTSGNTEIYQQPHRDRSGMPATCGQASKQGIARELLIQVEGLWIESGGKGFDLIFTDGVRIGFKVLPYAQVFKVIVAGAFWRVHVYTEVALPD